MDAQPRTYVKKDFMSDQIIRWCPGCGDYAILSQAQTVFAELGIPRDALYTRLDEEGYSGPPMPLICLDRIVREETLQPGDRVVSFVTEVSKFMQAGYSVRYG